MRRLRRTGIALGLLIGLPAALGPPSGAGDLDNARTTLQKWVETQQIISREKKDWQQDREILVSRIEALKGEIAQLRDAIGALKAARAEAGKAHTGVLAERDALRTSAADLIAPVGELEAKVRVLFKTLPEPLMEKILPLYQRMPDNPETSRVSLAERFQNVLGILNEMNRLNGEITLASEIRPLSDGKPSEVRTVYVGLGQAYFVSAGGEAGIGHPTADGWSWQKANDLAPRISQVLEILQNKSSPAFVPLPVTIR